MSVVRLLAKIVLALALIGGAAVSASMQQRDDAGSVVHVVVPNVGFGTGFYIGGGQFVTAAHVVADGVYQVTLRAGALSFTGNVLWVDEKRDVAVLQAEPPSPMPMAKLTCDGRADAEVGTPVHSIGYPLNLGLVETWGRVAGGVVKIEDISQRELVTNLTIAPGNSGGPVFDDQGEVIGMSDAIIQGLDFGFLIARSDICASLADKHEPFKPKTAKPTKRKPRKAVTPDYTTGN